MMKCHVPALLGFSLLAHASLPAENTSLHKIGFGAPEVVKLDWSTRSLTPTDIDGDGLRDLAVINNDAGKIEFLYQLPKGEAARDPKKSVTRSRWEPVLEDALFEKRALTVGFPVFDMVMEDLNGDGRVDLAYTSGEVPLTVRYQDEDGEWVDSREYDGFEAVGWTHSIKAADVDMDGSVELFVLAADAIRVFRPGRGGDLNEPRLLYTSGENPFNLMLFDATADGLPDLLYLSTDGRQVLAMREQIAGGQFGPESRHMMERPARVVVPLGTYAGGAPTLGLVNSRTGSLEFLRLRSPEVGVSESGYALEHGAPEIYPIFNKMREAASYALGDVNGDGERDLVVANPGDAELVLLANQKGRFQASQAFPSFSSVSSLSVGRFFNSQREKLIVLSEEEKTMGLCGLDAGGRLSFPRQLKIGSGNPVVTATTDLDDDGYDELLFVSENAGNYTLAVAAPADRQAEDSAWEVLFDLDLAGVRRKPSAILTIDVFGGATPGLMLFVPREPPVLLQPRESAEGLAFKAIANESSIRESLFKSLDPAETSVFDVDGDGLNELVVARTGFARAFKVVSEDLEMVDQFNARRGGDEIDAVIPLYTGSKVESIALYVAAERELQFLARDRAGVFRYSRSKEVGRLDLQGWYRVPAVNPQLEKDAFLFAGEDRFWYFNSHNLGHSWVVEDIYETDLEDIHYSHLAGADFDGDHVPELVAVDGNEHILDVLRLEESEFQSLMFWQVFEQNMHYQGRTGAKLEPRQIVIDDLTADGLHDLVLLVHDRILIYPQR
ncbi:hypothetical protein DDZ13_12880 [Coraliomargarita sinensis]|uniref:VCBS repeat-containing protein n=1 Tax=Coraliomargarita sinensis TaxID=2174842 RepID=A0A317ZIU6_9BACT|nr:FG-GAP and VCBS repeat-containing protein [Coraliomargarita sinensis]PXA03311.1 hypothetical protein DDZ13_12880 [Coraliomargarita sinensis]